MLAIYDGNGTLQCRYVYDAWGNHKVLNADGTENASTEFIGNKNPFRYRSYYWDSEFALYYLKSRYYDPELGRFISADGVSYLNPESVAGMNLYAYCENNPVKKIDSNGHFGIMALIGITLVSMVIGGVAQLVTNAVEGKTGDDLWRGVAGATLGAGVNALVLCLTIPTGGMSMFLAAGAGALVQSGVNTLETVIRGETVNWGETVLDLGINFLTTLAGNYIGSKIIPTNPGWFQPKKFLSVFTKPYGQKILMQNLIGAGISVYEFLNRYLRVIPNIGDGNEL